MSAVRWSDILWRGIAEDSGCWLMGQLLKVRDDFYICTTYAGQWREDGELSHVIGRWYKVLPYTIERVVVKEMTEEEEENFKREWLKKSAPATEDIEARKLIIPQYEIYFEV